MQKRRTCRRLLIGVFSIVFCLLILESIPLFGKKITFLTPPWGVPPDKKLLEEFETTTGIKVEVISRAMNELYSKVQIASATRQAPADVIFLSEEAPSYIVAPGYLEPLDGYVKNSPDLNVNDIARLGFWKVRGKQYGITTYVQMVMMDYNSERLKKAGFSNPPDTWDELVNMALKIKSSGIEEYPVSFGAISWSWYLIALSMGEKMFDSNLNPVFDQKNSLGRKALNLLMDMFNKYKLITPSVLGEYTPHGLFMGGIGTFHQSWQGAYIAMNNPKVSKQAPNVRYMLLPDKHYTWALDAAIGISRFSRNKKEAWRFIKWYLGKENQVAIFKAVGLMPSRLSVQEYLRAKGLTHQYELQVEQAKYVYNLPRYKGWWGEWDTYGSEVIRKGVLKEMTPDEMIDALSKQWKELQQKYE